MKLSVMQPYLFPYLGYFQLISATDAFVSLDDVNYINRGWINRNRILVQGKEHLFTVPLVEASQHKLIRDIRVDRDERKLAKLMRTIEVNYRRARYFSDVFPIIQRVLCGEFPTIDLLAESSLREVCGYLDLPLNMQKSSLTPVNPESRGQQRIVEICRHLHASTYINPIGGADLYSRDLFLKSGIRLLFLKMREIRYSQFALSFIPCLSIIDVLMFNSRDETRAWLSEHDLT